jgi:hypothetical protein
LGGSVVKPAREVVAAGDGDGEVEIGLPAAVDVDRTQPGGRSRARLALRHRCRSGQRGACECFEHRSGFVRVEALGVALQGRHARLDELAHHPPGELEALERARAGRQEADGREGVARVRQPRHQRRRLRAAARACVQRLPEVRVRQPGERRGGVVVRYDERRGVRARDAGLARTLASPADGDLAFRWKDLHAGSP